MKKNLGIVAILTVLALTACNNNTPSTSSSSSQEPIDNTPVVEKVLRELRYSSYTVDFDQTLSILRPNDKYAVDVYQHYANKVGYYYEENGDGVAYSIERNADYADLDKTTHEPLANTERSVYYPTQTYYKDHETGYAVYPKITYQNLIEDFIIASQDQETGEYIPYIYDEAFKNPFEFVEEEHLTYVEGEKEVSLEVAKARLVLSGYGAVGINETINSAKITLDDNNLPTALVIDVKDEVYSTYTRTNTFTVTFGLDAEYYVVKPYTNDNPKLAEALTKYEGLTNYTYNKEYVTEEGETLDHITGFYTEDLVYFHHGYADDGKVYDVGDNYDYLASKGSDGIYTVYDCTTTDGVHYNWGIVMASETQPLTYNNMYEMGPQYFDFSAAVFKDIGNNQYEIEKELVKESGQYFDYGVWGVDSADAETQTSKLVVTLNNNNEIALVEMSYYSGGLTYNVEYRYENIGTTEIPSWLNFGK